MEICEFSNAEYESSVTNPFTRFQSAAFYALNAHKVDEVKYFVFSDEKTRFAFVGGLCGNVLKFPFSASFECFSEISLNNKISRYHTAVATLKKKAAETGVKKITVALPPVYYAPSHISKLTNALFANGFSLKTADVNYEYYLNDFSGDYEKQIAYNARKSLHKAMKYGLIFEKTDDFQTVYEVIRQNREGKGYPLRMSCSDVSLTAEIIPSDYFLVRDALGIPVASALCHHITDKVVRVVYWGNIPETEKLCPMNFLSFNLFQYYAENGKVEIIDIGPSTQNSLPNFGLCDFKEGIGCRCSVKPVFETEL